MLEFSYDMPPNEPIAGAEEGLKQILAPAVSPSADPQTALAVLDYVNSIVNASIPIIITLVMVAAFVHIFRWVKAEQDSEEYKSAIKGATRGLIALFIMVNIWTVIRLVDGVAALSPLAAYTIFFLSFLIFGFWSLFSIGDSFVALLSKSVDLVLDYTTAGLRSVLKNTHWFSSANMGAQRAISLGLIVLLVSAVSLLFW